LISNLNLRFYYQKTCHKNIVTVSGFRKPLSA
jgi:hypothetical protein